MCALPFVSSRYNYSNRVETQTQTHILTQNIRAKFEIIFQALILSEHICKNMEKCNKFVSDYILIFNKNNMKYKYLLFELILILNFQSYSCKFLKKESHELINNKISNLNTSRKLNFKFRIHFKCKHIYIIVLFISLLFLIFFK